jgi:hypothetical protein
MPIIIRFQSSDSLFVESKYPALHPPSRSRQQKHYVIRGLPSDTNQNGILDQLIAKGVSATKVTQMMTSKPTAAQRREREAQLAEEPNVVLSTLPKRTIPLFHVEISGKQSGIDIETVSSLCYLVVKI